VSGCYPLDPRYNALPERERVNQLKKDAAERLAPEGAGGQRATTA
jgi:hypothetical protein